MPTEKLIAGFKEFRRQYYEDQPEIYKTFVDQGQSPDTMVIACSDSRVNPSIITQAHPGELFVVRNVANLVPPCAPGDGLHGTGAAIEYGVKDLKVKTIIVMGHSHCGGIRWMAEGHLSPESRAFVDSWVTTADPAKPGTVTDETLRAAEKKAVTLSLENLLTYPWVKEAVEKGNLEVLGWLFDMEQGQLLGYSTDTGWSPLS